MPMPMDPMVFQFIIHSFVATHLGQDGHPTRIGEAMLSSLLGEVTTHETRDDSDMAVGSVLEKKLKRLN